MTNKDLMRLIAEAADELSESGHRRIELEELADRVFMANREELQDSWEESSLRNVAAKAKRYLRGQTEEMVEPAQQDWIKKYLPGDTRVMYTVPKATGGVVYVPVMAMQAPDQVGHLSILDLNVESASIRRDEFANQMLVLRPYMPDDETTVGEALGKMASADKDD